jgi:signal transduction histidine kinase/FixJ family two-component response regulator
MEGKGAARPIEVNRIYLVDDEPLVLRALLRVIKQEGYDTRTFSGPAGALDALEDDLPDCIISDYYMPDADGLTFLERVRDLYPQVARVLLTGGHIDDRVKRALQEGTIQLLVQKPWRTESIRQVMKHIERGVSNLVVASTAVTSNPEPPGLTHAERESTPIVQEGKPVVLLVDDDESFLHTTSEWLAGVGFQPRIASSAESALDLACKEKPDLVVVDLLMPVHDGFDLLRALRDQYPRIPLIAITGAREKDMALDAFNHGATVFLHKPLEMETLEATIRRCLQLGELFFNGTKNAHLSAVLELQHAIASGMPISRLLHQLLQTMLRYTRADSASVLLLEPEGRTLRIAASYGLDESVVERERVAVGERVSGWVVKHNEPQIVIGSAVGDSRLAGSSRETPVTVGMCLPMRGRKHVVGALCLTRFESHESFARDAVDVGMLLGGEVAQAIERNTEAEQQANLERTVMRQDKMVTIGELAAGVAHEINNPLSYVRSNISSLKEYLEEVLPALQVLAAVGDGENPQPALSKVRNMDLEFLLSDLPVCLRETQEGVERVLRIVSDLKAFARDDEDAKEEGNINQILEGTVNILLNQIKNKAELVQEYADLPTIPCYPSQLGQVFLNLLYNAVQSIERQGRIIVRTVVAEGAIAIEIEDNGQGMEPKVLKRIFEPFFTTKPRGVGTGLGLSIARKIIRRHGGTLDAVSEKGRGTTFRISLPLEQED